MRISDWSSDVCASDLFKAISAVLSGLPEVRQVLAEAAHRFAEGRRTVLFVDEVHRFNKTQQDAFLPHIERGTIVFVGATTENPSFELNSALLSRCRVHVMEAVSPDDILRSEEHTSELQSLMRISYAVFCLK